MPIRKTVFVEDELYHLCNRGVDKRNIFLDEKDYFRFIHDLYEFNDKNAVRHPYYRFSEAGPPKMKPERDLTVDIHAFALMPNHFHLLLSQRQDNGIKDFMHKLGTGFAMYFNGKYKRSGTLFQSTFRAVHIEKDAHLTHLPFYIHANPLDIKFPKWKEEELEPEKAMRFLEKYRWSSFQDYIGIKNFPSVIEKRVLTPIIGSPSEYKDRTMNLLKEINLDRIQDVILE